MTQAQEAVAKLPPPKLSLPSPALKPGSRPKNRPKPPPPEAKPTIKLFAR